MSLEHGPSSQLGANDPPCEATGRSGPSPVIDGRTFVTIAMPALNEARYIEAAVHSILPDPDSIDCEVIVADGGSRDETCAIIGRLAREDGRIRLVHNRDRHQAAGVNLAARSADQRSRVLIRADCHAVYPERFVERCLATMAATGATSVVVAMNTRGRTCLQRGIAAAQNSRMGNGGSAHRLKGLRGFIDHGHHAAIDLATFQALRGYDNDGHHNEDAEFDCRLAAAGGRIFLDGAIVIDYYPRDTLTSLALQYANYGQGRANTALKHRQPLKLRQIAPLFILLSAAVGGGLAMTTGQWWFAAPSFAYALAVALFSIWLAIQQKNACSLLAAPAAVIMHLNWGAGFLWRLVTGPRRPVASCSEGFRDAARDAGRALSHPPAHTPVHRRDFGQDETPMAADERSHGSLSRQDDQA